MVKVKSHIPIEEATNEFFWVANDTADQLATKARQTEAQERYTARQPVMLPGSMAGCYIEGKLQNNNLKKKLQSKYTKKICKNIYVTSMGGQIIFLIQ